MSTLSFDFRGRSAIVTGGARGIGLELARGFRAAGADTYLVDLDQAEVAAAAESIGANGLVADVRCSEDAERAVASVLAETGRIDVVVNNAGITRDAVVWKLDDESWSAVLDVHLGGTLRFIRACVPAFREAGGGRVVNVTSYSGLHGNFGQSAYAAAKAGIVGLTKTAAKELARFGVTVNAISPNAETPMVASMPAEAYERIRASIPLGRFADPAEIWPAVGFLASDEAAYVTGAVLAIDGGMAM